jgi:hypothetical protein
MMPLTQVVGMNYASWVFTVSVVARGRFKFETIFIDTVKLIVYALYITTVYGVFPLLCTCHLPISPMNLFWFPLYNNSHPVTRKPSDKTVSRSHLQASDSVSKAFEVSSRPSPT